MPLDYRLWPDSPLLRDGAFERITCRPLREDSFDPALEFEFIRNGSRIFSKLTIRENMTRFR